MKLYYVHDPMCSWCWAYRPTLQKLRSLLPAHIQWRNLLGGLAADSEAPMPDDTRRMVMAHWRRIQQELGTEFNFDFWVNCEPRRSTYIACRAVLAAKEQSREEEMILSIQQAYYLRAMNPSDIDTLLSLANDLDLDAKQFLGTINSNATQQALQVEISQSRSWPVSGFPSFVLQTADGVRALPLDYRDPLVTLDAIEPANNPAY